MHWVAVVVFQALTASAPVVPTKKSTENPQKNDVISFKLGYKAPKNIYFEYNTILFLV